MPGDWIKIETTTPDKPEVVQLAALTRLDQDAVVGKLVRVWAWADANSVNGESMPVSVAFIDRLVGRRGFGAAMRAVGWLLGEDAALTFPRFDRHNGRPAKARAVERDKKRTQRGHEPPSCPDASGTNVPMPPGQNGGLEREREIEEEKRQLGRLVDRTLSGPESPIETPPPGPRPEVGKEPEPPTLQAVLAFCRGPAGISPEVGETWWNECDGVGWRDGKGRPIVRWQSTLIGYARKWEANEHERRWRGNGRHRTPVAATTEADHARGF